MANEPQWEPIEAPPWATKPAAPAAPQAEPKWEPIEAPSWAAKPERPSRTVLERAGEAVAETAGGAWEAAKRAVVPPPKEEAKKYLGPAGAWRSFKETGESLLSPITGTIGTAISGVGSPLASGVSEAARVITGGDPKHSEMAYEYAKPMAEAALGSAGRMPGIAGTGKFPMPDVKVAGTKKTPTQTMEGEAGRYLEGKARDPATLRQKLDQPIEEIAGPGDKPSTFQHTGEFGQIERRAARSESHSDEFIQQKAAQNAARQRTMEQTQPPGDPMAVVNDLRTAMQAETRAADTALAQARQRAQQIIDQEGGRLSPDTEGNIYRRELEIAEENVRANERTLWQRVDPDGTLQSNPQPIQELERRVYGNLPEAASLTSEETRLAGVIQNYRPVIPFRELTALRSEVSGALRSELYTNGRTPAYARLSQLRQGIEEAIPRSFGPEGQAGTGVAERLRAASAATRERVERFRPTRGITRKEGVEGPYKLEDVSTIPEKIIASGTKGYDRVSQYFRAVGNDRGMPEITDGVLSRMRREVIGPNGEVDPRKLEGFLRRYQDTLRAIDERDGGAFSTRMRNIQTAQEAIETATEARAAITKKYNDDQFNALIGATNETDATSMIANIFGKQDSVARAQELMRRLRTPEAQEGARAAVVRHIRDQLTSNAQLGEDLLLRAEQFQNWMKNPKNNGALRQILTPEQVKNLENIARSMRRANQSNQTKAIGGGSDTYQMEQAGQAQQGAFREMAETMLPWAVRTVVHPLIGVVGGVPGMAASGIADFAVSRMLAKRAAKRAATEEGRIQAVQELIDDALLNPEKMRALLKQTYSYKSTGMPGAKKATAYGATTIGTEVKENDDQRKKRVAREAGGGVPAIGGTGGRSPGAGETSFAGAARQGAGQALPDGGTARQQQLAYEEGGEVKQPEVKQQAPLGLRERHAAMLTGTPASGPSFERLATTRKGPAALTREDIRKTLQSFGIAGEAAGGFSDRQLGERVDVDSRAEGGSVKRTKGSVNYSKGMKQRRCGLCRYYSSDHKCEKVQGYIGPGMWCELFERAKGYAIGGSVDYETGERNPARYDPGDETTFGARFGQWDQTATGKSLPRDDEEIDTTIMAPGQKMIDPLGHRGERGNAGYYYTRGMAEGGKVGVLPVKGEENKAAWPLGAIVLGPRPGEPGSGQTVPYPYKEKLGNETGNAQLNVIGNTKYDQPQQWLRFKRDQLQNFMENAPPPTGGVERTYGMLEQLRPQPQINYALGPSTLEDRGEQPSVLAEQLGYRSLTAPRARAGPTEQIPLPRPRPYQEGGAVNADSRSADRWEQLPTSQNVEDRRGEDELSIGQLIAASQAFMGHYPSPYTRRRQPASAEASAEAAARGGGSMAVPPEALIEQTQRYIAEQLAGVEDPHEKQDPYEAAIEEMGGYRKNHPRDGGSDEGRLAGGGVVKSGISAMERMLRASRGQAPIRGLPQQPLDVGGEKFIPGPSADVREAAEQYMREKGLPYTPLQNYVPVDEPRARAIARAYDVMPHRPTDPEVQRSYEALAKETRDQYELLKRSGAKFEPVPRDMPDPYGATPRLAAKDFLENKHMYYFPTEAGFGSEASGVVAKEGQKMLEPSGVKIGGKEVPFNDLFRVVHDVFGHHKEGVGFRAAGEENAWRSHGRMYSPEALPAMTSETRGQNSWVNYGPYAKQNKGASAADTVYAPQKLGIIPPWVVRSGRMTPLGVAGAAAALEEGDREREDSGYRFADGGGIDEPPMPDAVMDSWGDPFERAALRTKRGVLGAETMQGRGRPGDKFVEDPSQKEEAAKRVFDFTVPQSPLDLGLMALGGPFRLPIKAGALALGTAMEPSEAEAGKLGTVRKLTGTKVPAAGRAVTRGHNLPPEELAPYPHFAEEYPAVGPPVMKPKTKPKYEGETYAAKQLTPEAEAFQKERLRIQKNMDKEGYTPFFDPAKRTQVDPSNYPAANVDTLTLQPSKPKTLMEYQDVINMPATRQLLQEAYDRGLKLGNAENWYAMAQLEEAYVNELGPAAGRKAFLDEFAVPMSATTSGNDPETNFLMAQYAEHLRKQGKALPEEGHQLPVTVGGRRGSVNIRDYNAMRERGGYQGFGKDQPKMHNFTRNIIGDPSRATIDEQMATGMTEHISDVDPKFADRGRRQAFGLMEKPVHELAAAAGVPPANFQDVAWAGFKNEPGKPLISTINDAVERTHRLTGMPREEIVRRGLIRKEIPIYGLTAAATPYLWGGFRPQEGGSSNPTPAGQLPL